MTTQATNAQSDAKTSVGTMERELSAAFLASGLGSLALGITVLLTEMKATAASVQNALKWVGPVGPLSGKTTVAVIVFIVSWVALYFGLKNRAVKLGTMFIISLVLVVLGLLLTFPPVFEIFAQ